MQMRWKKHYNKNDLHDAAVHLSMKGLFAKGRFVEFVRYELRDPEAFDWSDSMAGHRPCGIYPGWGVGMRSREIFEETGLDPDRYSTHMNSPVIEIDGYAGDGYGRTTLAHARGSKLLVAVFRSFPRPRKESVD